jgi:hypothetical protein
MIYASLGLDWSQYAKGLKDAATSTKSAFGNITKNLASGDIKGTLSAMTSAIASIPPPLAALAATAAVVGLAAKGMWDAMGKAKDMNVLAESAGMTATQFSVLDKTFSKVGIDAEQLPGIMSKMAASMDQIGDPASKTSEALKKIGISAAMLDGKSQYDQFKMIAAGIDGLTSSTTKAQVARTLFGRGGAALLPGMKPGMIASAEKKISPMAHIAEESGGSFLAFQGAVKGLKVDIGGFFAGMASNVVPALQSVVEGLGYAARWLNKVLADSGKTIGFEIGFWITALKGGMSGIMQAIAVVFQGMVLLMVQAINSGISTFYAAADSIKQKFGFGKTKTEAPQIDTKGINDAFAEFTKPLFERIQADQQAAAEKKSAAPGGLELPAAKGGGSMALPDLSSLQKVGGGMALLSGGQDNSPAYQTMRIQEDIRGYIKELINVVKQGGNDYNITPPSGGMVLTA